MVTPWGGGVRRLLSKNDLKISFRRARVVLGAWDPKAGAAGSLWDVVRDRRLNHRPEVGGGVLEQECGRVLREFFEAHRHAGGGLGDAAAPR